MDGTNGGEAREGLRGLVQHPPAALRFWVWGLGSRDWGVLGCGVWFGDWGLGLGVSGLRFEDSGLEFEAWGLGVCHLKRSPAASHPRVSTTTSVNFCTGSVHFGAAGCVRAAGGCGRKMARGVARRRPLLRGT